MLFIDGIKLYSYYAYMRVLSIFLDDICYYHFVYGTASLRYIAITFKKSCKRHIAIVVLYVRVCRYY